MFQLIEGRGFPPTRHIRYCCSELKEYGGKGRVVVTGVRWEESAKRATRPVWEENYKGKKQTFLHPIIDWTTKDIWEYIHSHNLPYCSLYDEGFERIGCIMCPLQRKEGIEREAARYPKFYKAYLRAMGRAIKNKPEKTVNSKHKTAETMMYWWINGYEQDLRTRQNFLNEFGIDIFENDGGCGSVGDEQYD
jgi:phosphoadenosine phosphosulfate reductase